jgi:lactobin A/cerein 7B family class IIb bacteriocin
MITSYGETSGFSPVTSEELEKVNGGLPPILIGILIGCASATLTSCAQVTNSPQVNRNGIGGGK